MLDVIYQKYNQYFLVSLDELKNNLNLTIIYNEEVLVIYDEEILYCYLNINGFKPFDFKLYKEIHISKKEYDKIHFEKNSKYQYEKEIINNIMYKLKYMPKTQCHTKDDFKSLLNEIYQVNQKKSLLLHSCCGPCSSYCLEFLHKYFDITIYYSNSNIDTIEEFTKRVETQKEIINNLGYDIKLIIDEYNPADYTNSIKGLENLGEFSKRCYNCYKLRLSKTFEYALKNKYDYVSTTLSISPYKNSTWINEIGIELEKKCKQKFLYSNFKLNDGYKKSIELSKKFNLYRQDYCGCSYSKKERGN